MRITFVFILIFCFTQIALSQEVLKDIPYNSSLINIEEGLFKNDIIRDTLELPFIDDFSEASFYPDARKWIDRFAFVNKTYPILPPSIGVATLDAFNETGRHYDEAGYQPYIADYLTSLPINLDLNISDSIYLSFYYQPGGIGNSPEDEDSLTLEFYDVDSSLWNVVWNTKGFSSDKFFHVLIPIKDSIYLKKGFQFRFRNYVSFDADIPSYFSNVDQWHIDYVYLNKNRSKNDTIIHDVAFVEPPRSLLKNYEAIPWGEHFKAGRVYEQGNMRYSFRNNDTIVRNTAYTYYLYKNTTGLYVKDDSAYLGQINLNADSLLIKRYEIDASFFETNALKEGLFKLEFVLETDDFDYHENDTVVLFQNFKNYYAYDDGTSENGYGIDAINGMVAYKFETYVEDTLQGVDIYFNHTLENANQKYFKLRVWNNLDGVPGYVIYEKSFQVGYGETLNDFFTFEFDSSFTVSGTFYIGWQQITDDFLNIGFDRNRNNNDKLFYNLNGVWYNSSFEGSLMMRPLFGDDISTSLPLINNAISEIKIYPNPATDFITIETKPEIRNFEAIIFDNMGRIVLQSSQIQINTRDLTPGLYHVLIFFGNKKYTQKLLIQK